MKKRLFSLTVLILALTYVISFSHTSAEAAQVIAGDVDGDRLLTAADSLLILRYSVGLENFTKTQLSVADFDGNGRVDAGDSLTALRRSVGVTEKPKEYPFKDYAYEVLELLNKERAKANIPPLELDETLCKASDLRAEEISYRYELKHLRKDGRDWDTILDEFNIDWHFCGENIGGGRGAEKVCSKWIASPGHLKNILNPNYTKLGVGYYFNEDSQYGYYWVTNFIG